MNERVEYYTADSLAVAAGVSRRVFFKHLKYDVGQVTKAREVYPGLGIRYNARGCRKYLALVKAGQELKAARSARASGVETEDVDDADDADYMAETDEAAAGATQTATLCGSSL